MRLCAHTFFDWSALYEKKLGNGRVQSEFFFSEKCEDIDLGNALKVMYLCGEAGELAHIVFSNKVIVITYYGGSGQGRVDICDISDELGYMVTERILITAENLKEVLQKAIRDINKNDLFD